MTETLEPTGSLPISRSDIPGSQRWAAALLSASSGLLLVSSVTIGFARADAPKAVILLPAITSALSAAATAAARSYISITSRADVGDFSGAVRNLEGQFASRSTHAVDGSHAEMQEKLATLGSHAALATGLFYAFGAAVPLALINVFDRERLIPIVATVCLCLLAASGAVQAQAEGGSPWRRAARLVLLGSLAIALTAAAGRALRIAI